MWCNGLAQGSVEPQDWVQFPVSAPFIITMTFKTARGVQDSDFKREIAKNKIIDVARQVFEKNGFNPLQTPIIERFDTLTNKYAGGEEIVKEIYSFTDQGDRKLGLRYDHTVPLARYISEDRSIKLPFKRYQIGKVFRDGPIKKGRLREFYQCDVDIVGSKNVEDEGQLIKMVSNIFKAINIKYVAKINNRKVLDDILKYLDIPEDKHQTLILTIDKLEKKGKQSVIKELEEKSVDKKKATKLLKLLHKDLNEIKDIIQEETFNEVNTLLTYLQRHEVNFEFTPSLARGLQYYTGSIYEFFFANSDIKSSIAAGGRYDNMIGDFIQDNQKYPSVGISIGLDIILEEVSKDKKSVVDLFIIPIGVDLTDLINNLRNKNINVDVNAKNRGISAGFKYAEHYNISNVLLVGSNELEEEKYTLKNLESGKEKKVSFEELLTLF